LNYSSVYDNYKWWLGIEKCWNEVYIINNNYDPNQAISLH
jgi:hypothetical protein